MAWGGDGTMTKQQELRTNAALSEIRNASRALADAVGKWIENRTTGNEEVMIAAHKVYKKAQVNAVTRKGANGW